MNTDIFYAALFITSLSILAHRFHVWRKGPIHLRELRAHVNAIFEVGGCAKAHAHLQDAIDIVERYGFSLRQAGYNGTIERLTIEADLSAARYKRRLLGKARTAMQTKIK